MQRESAPLCPAKLAPPVTVVVNNFLEAQVMTTLLTLAPAIVPEALVTVQYGPVG